MAAIDAAATPASSAGTPSPRAAGMTGAAAVATSPAAAPSSAAGILPAKQVDALGAAESLVHSLGDVGDPIDDEALLADVDDDPFRFDPLAEQAVGEHESKEPEAAGAAARAGPPDLALEEATVARLRQEIDRLRVPAYADNLEAAARPEEVVLGLLSPEEAAEREAALEDARLREAAREAERFARREAALAMRRARARAEVIDEKAAAARSVREQELQALESRAEVEEAVRRAYREARSALAEELRRQRAVVMERFGVLEAQPQGSVARARLAKHSLSVAWAKVPQPLRIAVHQVRGVKDRLPRGRYVVLVTLWDRLGGRPLRWSRLGIGAGAGSYKGLARPAATRPVRHAGRFYDTELDFRGRPVFTLSPADVDLAPSHTLVLELFLLGGKRSPVDRVVAWTALPCADSDLRPVEGRFRLPLLRGEVDLEVDQYVKMERRWGTDLDTWLGNLYVEVTRVPREQLGDGDTLVGEYDVEVAYTSEVLRLRQARLRKLEEEEGGRRGKSKRRKKAAAEELDDEAWDMADSDAEGAADAGSSLAVSASGLRRRPGSKRGAFRGRDAAEADAPLLSAAWDSDEEGEDRWAGGVAASAPSGRRAAGLGRVRHAVPGAARGRGAPGWSTRPLASIQSYGFAVSKQETRGIGRGRRLGEATRKGIYLRQELFGDVLPSSGGAGLCSITALAQLLALLVALYIRGHVHYIGQWLFLQLARIPVYELSLNPVALSLKYVGSVLPMEMELGVVIAGPLTVLLFEAVMCLVCLLVFLCLRHIPELVSRFVAFFGVAAILNPLIVFIVDLATTNYGCTDRSIHPQCVPDFTSRQCRCFEGDAFKLYYRFLRTEGSGVVGIVLTVFIYCILALLGAFLLYAFLLHLHLDGRMLDLYRRIHGPESAFSAPHDLELSARELQWIVDKSRRWRSAQGSSRRVAVCEYELTDPLDAGFREVTTHLIIYHATVDGRRELYRHFLRQPDGTVVEVFGDMEAALGSRPGRGGSASEPTPLQRVLLSHARDDEQGASTLFPGL